MGKSLEYELHDIKDGQKVVKIFSFASWHRGELEESIKKAGKGSAIACLWEFVKDIKIDDQYLQYMTAHGRPPKEWIDPLPKMIFDNKGYLTKGDA